ncbi:MAG: hypothetical protein A2104_00455 [Candidatus Melainabacteria bacterium GWF2_32_7]|nr:MAG: hypothetical protein A2104_00455 [Candidatus Melainabacteria bacterium GWF2_32_7]
MSKSKGEFKVKFRGVRGSYPVSSKNTLKYGGNTGCIEIRVNGYLIIIDSGTGIINLGNDLVKDYIVSGTDETNRDPITGIILYSHTHTDHIQGLPFFKPAYMPTSKFYLFGAKSMGFDFQETLSQSMYAPFSPIDLEELPAYLDINNLKNTDIIVLSHDNDEPVVKRIHECDKIKNIDELVTIKCMKSSAHPRDGVLVFKVSWKGKSLVCATDKESYVGGDSKLIYFARNANLLIHDAQYTQEDYTSLTHSKQGFGHSTPEMAIETARLANVKKLVLFHHDPTYEDSKIDVIEENAKKQFKNTIAAYEGLEIDLM